MLKFGLQMMGRVCLELRYRPAHLRWMHRGVPSVVLTAIGTVTYDVQDNLIVVVKLSHLSWSIFRYNVLGVLRLDRPCLRDLRLSQQWY